MKNMTGLKNNEITGNGYGYNFEKSPVYRIKNELLRKKAEIPRILKRF